MSHLPYMCQNCISFSHLQNSCREPSSPFFGGSISPFHIGFCMYIGIKVVYGYKSRPCKQIAHAVTTKTGHGITDPRDGLGNTTPHIVYEFE